MRLWNGKLNARLTRFLLGNFSERRKVLTRGAAPATFRRISWSCSSEKSKARKAILWWEMEVKVWTWVSRGVLYVAVTSMRSLSTMSFDMHLDGPSIVLMPFEGGTLCRKHSISSQCPRRSREDSCGCLFKKDTSPLWGAVFVKNAWSLGISRFLRILSHRVGDIFGILSIIVSRFFSRWRIVATLPTCEPPMQSSILMSVMLAVNGLLWRVILRKWSSFKAFVTKIAFWTDKSG